MRESFRLYRVVHAALPNFEPPYGGDFDGVLCSAVLMHIAESELVPAAVAIKRCLKNDGRLLYSVPSKRLAFLSKLYKEVQLNPEMGWEPLP